MESGLQPLTLLQGHLQILIFVQFDGFGYYYYRYQSHFQNQQAANGKLEVLFFLKGFFSCFQLKELVIVIPKLFIINLLNFFFVVLLDFLNPL